MTFSLKDNHTLLVSFLLLHAVLWTLIPSIFHPNIPLDVAEITAWGKEWQLGYYKHPPLVPWLTEAAGVVFGRSGSTYFFLSQLCIVGGMLLLWQLAKYFVSERQAVFSIMLLEGVYYYNVTSIEFNHNVILLLIWPWMLLTFWLAVSTQKLRYWLVFSIAAAMGVLAKYYTLVLLLAMVLMVLSHKVYRKKTFNHIAPYLSALLFFLLLLPHGVWLLSHDFITLQYVAQRTGKESHWWHHVLYPGKFLLAQLVSILGSAIIILWGYRKCVRSLPLPKEKYLFLLWMLFAPLVITLVFSMVTGAKLRSMWGTPLWGMLGIVFFSFFHGKKEPENSKHFIKAVLCFMAIAVITHIVMLSASHHKRAHFNGYALAKTIEKKWHDISPDQPLTVIAGDGWLTGNVAFYAKSRPSVWVDLAKETSPWINSKDLKSSGVMVIWPVDDDQTMLPHAYQKVIKETGLSVEEQGEMGISWRRNKVAPVKIGWAVLH